MRDSSDSEFKRLLNFDNSLLEGKKEEGYVPLDDDIEYNYIGIKEESGDQRGTQYIYFMIYCYFMF